MVSASGLDATPAAKLPQRRPRVLFFLIGFPQTGGGGTVENTGLRNE